MIKAPNRNEVPNIKLFNKVVDRAVNELDVYKDEVSYRCDLLTAHTDIGLDFEKLLAFPIYDFVHDMRGIANNVDRYKNKVENGFVPRCALPEEVV